MEEEEEEMDESAQAAMAGAADAAVEFADAYRNAREETLEDDRTMSTHALPVLVSRDGGGYSMGSAKVSPHGSPLAAASVASSGASIGSAGKRSRPSSKSSEKSSHSSGAKQPAGSGGSRGSSMGRKSARNSVVSLPLVAEGRSLGDLDLRAPHDGRVGDAKSAGARVRSRTASSKTAKTDDSEEMDSFAVDSFMSGEGAEGGAEAFAEAYRNKPEEGLPEESTSRHSSFQLERKNSEGSGGITRSNGAKSVLGPSETERSLFRAVSQSIAQNAKAGRLPGGGVAGAGTGGSSGGSGGSFLNQDFSLKMITMDSKKQKSSGKVAPDTGSAKSVPPTDESVGKEEEGGEEELGERRGGLCSCFGASKGKVGMGSG